MTITATRLTQAAGVCAAVAGSSLAGHRRSGPLARGRRRAM